MRYGGMLPQSRLVQRTDSDLKRVLEYGGRFAEKRFAGSVPLDDGGRLEWSKIRIENVSKHVLVYTNDADEPLLYDSKQHTDKLGQDEETGFVTMGTTYSFTLRWGTESASLYHYLTVTVCPSDPFLCNIYSHTFYIEYTGRAGSEDSLLKESFPRHLLITQGDQSIGEQSSVSKAVDQSHSLQQRSDQSDLLHTAHSLSGSGDSQSVSGSSVNSSLKHSLTPDVTSLKIMTYNIWNTNCNTNSDYVARMKLMEKVILEAAPDVVGFQEVRYEEGKGGDLGPNQVQTLLEMLPGYQFIHQPAQVQSYTLKTGRCEEGVAIFSKYPIVSHDHILLYINRSIRGDCHQRVCLHGEIVIPQVGKVHVFLTHLSLTHEAREQSVRQIWQYMQQFDGPALLLGDLNAEPEEKSMQFLRGQMVFPQQEDKSELKDVWLEVNRDRHRGYTFQCNASEADLDKRIDYIFMKPHAGCELMECHVVDNGKRGCDAASDHLPVQATLALTCQK